MVPEVFKCIINGISVFYLYPNWYLITQNNLFRNQPNETIEAVNKKKKKKKKKNELDQKTIITCPHVSQLHIQYLDLKMYIHHFE
jgi:hypothetical protein